MAAAKLLCAALACLQLAAADETAGECNAVVLTALPEAAVEYNSRFDESYSTYHKYPVALQHLATAATEEVLDAQKARNVFRSTPRVEISAGVVPTTVRILKQNRNSNTRCQFRSSSGLSSVRTDFVGLFSASVG